MGGGSQRNTPTAAEEANAQVTLERERARIAEEKAARDKATADAEKAAKVALARTKQGSALDYATDYLNKGLQTKGINSNLASKYGVDSTYNDLVNRTRMNLAEDDTNPMASMSVENWLNNAISAGQDKYRRDLTNNVNKIAGDGFEYNTFADTADDDILSQILDQQYSDAEAQTKAALARGQLSDTGYGRAEQYMKDAKDAAWADLQTIGQGVLSNYRKDLTGLKSNEVNRIGNLTFTDDYSPDAFSNLLSSKTNDMKNRLTGDLKKAVGSKSFFNPATYISSAGALQGYYNPTNSNANKTQATSNPLLDAFSSNSGSNSNNGVF